MPTAESALPGRRDAMPAPATHFVNSNPLQGPFPAHLRQAVFGIGCFWGVERKFWQLPGVYTTAAGYAAAVLEPAASVLRPVQRTAEDALAELLRPMLRTWLAENLPKIVERALRQELAGQISADQKTAAE